MFNAFSDEACCLEATAFWSCIVTGKSERKLTSGAFHEKALRDPRSSDRVRLTDSATTEVGAALLRLRKAVYDHIYLSGPLTLSEIPREWPVTRDHVRGVVAQLLDEGLLMRKGQKLVARRSA